VASGCEVVLSGPAMVPLVRAVARLSVAGLAPYAVVGGVAVSARLGQAHRATADVDAVVDETQPPEAAEALLALPGAEPDPTGAHRVRIEGTKVELIGMEPISAEDLGGLTDAQVLFIGSHSWALTTASELTVVAGADPAVRTTAPFATPASLVAMKLHALLNRRVVGDREKRAGDGWDVFRLLTDCNRDGSLAEALCGAPGPLLRVVRAAVDAALVSGAARTRSLMAAGDDQMASVTVDELRYVGGRLLEGLGRD
jgi:hypothetical protein